MTFIDHDHQHQWSSAGVEFDPSVEALFQVFVCESCDAWTSRELKDSARVPISQGDVVADGGVEA